MYNQVAKVMFCLKNFQAFFTALMNKKIWYKCLEVEETLLMIFRIHSESENAKEVNKMYNAIKERGST